MNCSIVRGSGNREVEVVTPECLPEAIQGSGSYQTTSAGGETVRAYIPDPLPPAFGSSPFFRHHIALLPGAGGVGGLADQGGGDDEGHDHGEGVEGEAVDAHGFQGEDGGDGQ